MHRGVSHLAKYDSENAWRRSFQQQDIFAHVQGSVSHIHKWHKWFITCVQTFNTLFSANQLHHLFLSSVLVFEKQIVRLQKAVSTSSESFLPSFYTRRILQWPHIFNKHQTPSCCSWHYNSLMAMKLGEWREGTLNLSSVVLPRFHTSKFSLYSAAHFTDRTYDSTM